jgi:integrase
MPKPQSGQLIWREPHGWYGRFYATVEGERVRVCRALHTENKAVARRKLARLIADGNVSSEEAQRPETFEEAARRVVDEQKAAGMSTWKDRIHRLEAYVLPRLGAKLPGEIKASHVLAVLEEVRDSGKSRQTMIHVKNDVSVVLGALWRAEILPENVCERVQVPEALPAVAEQSKKERAVLTDDELIVYLGWQHPDPRHRMAVLERQTMACVARMLGGQRTSDLHAVHWEHFELPIAPGAEGFSWGVVARRKGRRLAHGGRPQRLWVPEMLRPILADWWQRTGAKRSGPVFPKRRGEGAGKAARAGGSHADAFRRDLRRAFGIDRPVTTEHVRTNGRPLRKLGWEPARELTERERVLLEGTDYEKPVDFHSWRRAFNQALADAGVNAQQAQALAGHSTMAAHERYLRNTQEARTVPAGALPRIGHTRLGTFDGQPQKTAPLAENDDAITRDSSPLFSDPRNPKPALYQVEVHPDGVAMRSVSRVRGARSLAQRTADCTGPRLAVGRSGVRRRVWPGLEAGVGRAAWLQHRGRRWH